MSSFDFNMICIYEQLRELMGWINVGFDASSWFYVIVYIVVQVGLRGGYDIVIWNLVAKLIWMV